jgi:UDP-N-acetylglucosamine pyrophosphorylase
MTQAATTEFLNKMRAAGLSDAAQAAFLHNYEKLISGDSGLTAEADIQPVDELPHLRHIALETAPDPSLLSQCVIVKLNGGLGTSMGLEKAKSLLTVKDDLTFLDFIVRQILHLRAHHKVHLRFLLMNSFTTSRDTRDFLSTRYPDLGKPDSLQLMQNQVPKVDATSLHPVEWPENPQLEWCPPGHGDFYTALFGTGWLRDLLDAGVKYAFISNSDNLGASLDLPLLTWFARSGKPFVMEVAERTASDRKGGHVALKDGVFILRESAQCPESDLAAFQDIEKHRFFNTNNLWIRLDHLRPLL